MAEAKSGKLVIKEKRYRGTTGVVSARIPSQMIANLDRVVAKTGYNRNELIQICLEYAMDHMETEARGKA